MGTAGARETGLWRRWRTEVFIVLGAMVLLVLSLAFRAVLSPIALALAIAYILNPIMRWAERHRMPRGASAVLLFLVLFGAGVAVALFAVPPLVIQVYDFGVTMIGEPAADEQPGYTDLNGNGEWDKGHLPALLQRVQESSLRLSEGGDAWYDRVLQAVGRSSGAKEKVFQALMGALERAGGRLLALLGNLQSLAIGAALTAFYLFFFLMSFDRIVGAVHKRLPGKYRGRIEEVVRKIDAAISAFFRGRLLICAVVGALTAMGLAILGVPYWYLIGVVTGLAGIVPYLPIFVGMGPAMLVAWFDAYSGWTVAGAAIVFVVVQTLEGWVLTPWIQGKAVGLHPVTLTVALLVGYQVFGLFGMVIAVPLAATVKILAKEFVLPKVDQLAQERPEGES